MEKRNSVQRIGMLRQRSALLNDHLRLENEIRQIKQKLAELNAAIYLADPDAKEELVGNDSDCQQCDRWDRGILS